MRITDCDHPLQDECGAWYCPMSPENEEFDCDRCAEERDAEVDRQVEMRWEAMTYDDD